MNTQDRRTFLRRSITAATGLSMLPAFVACGSNTSAAAAPSPDSLPPEEKRKLGIAILGLGGYAKGQIGPALELTKHCELRGLITGTPDKLPDWQQRYGIKDENTYTYDRLEEIANNDAIDVVYVITPTATHRAFAVRAAKAGKHVWCEKPMAMTPEDCQAIIDACSANRVTLSVGYRMLHEPNTQSLIGLTTAEKYGPVTTAHAYAGYAGGQPPADNWRGQRHMGGGALYDMGVYTVNGLNYGTQMNPVAVVQAHQEHQDRPDGVDLTTTYTLRYANGMTATGKTSVVNNYNELHVEAERGWYELSPMQSYNGVKGQTSTGTQLGPAVPNQQSLQMDDDALAILKGTPVIAPGEMGKRDIAVIRAIIESAETNKEVKLV